MVRKGTVLRIWMLHNMIQSCQTNTTVKVNLNFILSVLERDMFLSSAVDRDWNKCIQVFNTFHVRVEGIGNMYYMNFGIQPNPIKTLQSLHAACRIIKKRFETNLDCNIVTRVNRLYHWYQEHVTNITYIWKQRRKIPCATLVKAHKSILMVYHDKGLPSIRKVASSLMIISLQIWLGGL